MTVAGLFSSGHVVDLILLVMAGEWLLILARAPSERRAAAGATSLLALAPGACLSLALRAALTGAAWPWVAVWLAAALPLHLADMAGRARPGPPPAEVRTPPPP